ncbi:MAG: ABC transporter permease subunit, partial [Anaerolineae bacterium]
YATAAKSFGYSRRAIITKVAFRNIIMPVTLYAAASLRALLVEAFVIEWLFQIKGLGWLFAAAIVPNGIGQGGGTSLYLHPPLLATLFSVYAFLFIVINQMADAIARRADPRG